MDRTIYTCETCNEEFDAIGIDMHKCSNSSAFSTQIGGSHYRDMPIQPAEYAIRNRLGFAEGAVVKYVSRWNKDGCGGIVDLRKARQFIDMLIEIEEAKGKAGA